MEDVKEVKKPAPKPKAKPELSDMAKKLKDMALKEIARLGMDLKQEKIELQKYLEVKLGALERLQAMNVKRVKSELSKDMSASQKELAVAGAMKYEKEIAGYKELLK